VNVLPTGASLLPDYRGPAFSVSRLATAEAGAEVVKIEPGRSKARLERGLMRVLHISGDALIGGVESFLITLARNRAVDPTSSHDFAFTVKGPAVNMIRLAGAQVHYLGDASYKQPKALRLARRRLNEVCREYKYDVAVFHQYPYLVAAFADVQRASGVRLQDHAASVGDGEPRDG